MPKCFPQRQQEFLGSEDDKIYHIWVEAYCMETKHLIGKSGKNTWWGLILKAQEGWRFRRHHWKRGQAVSVESWWPFGRGTRSPLGTAATLNMPSSGRTGRGLLCPKLAFGLPTSRKLLEGANTVGFREVSPWWVGMEWTGEKDRKTKAIKCKGGERGERSADSEWAFTSVLTDLLTWDGWTQVLVSDTAKNLKWDVGKG